MIVVLNAKLTRLIAAHANIKWRWEKKKPDKSDVFASESIIFPNDLCKPIEIYIYVGKKRPLASYPAVKHKTQQICHYRHATKTSGICLLYSTGINLSLRNKFANLRSFAKVSVPVQFIIPCFEWWCHNAVPARASSTAVGKWWEDSRLLSNVCLIAVLLNSKVFVFMRCYESVFVKLGVKFLKQAVFNNIVLQLHNI